MKHLIAFLILVYGAVVTYAMMILIGIGDAFSCWGDGATVRHVTPSWSVFPCAIFFGFAAAGPYFKERGNRGILLAFALVQLFTVFQMTMPGSDGVLSGLFAIVPSLLVWVPLLIWVPRPISPWEPPLR